MRASCLGAFGAAVIAAAMASRAAADQAPWLNPDWTARRVVDVKVMPARQPAGEAAVCAFFTGGLAKPDGSDIRVAMKGRTLTGHRVLQMGPGDFVRLAFAAVPDETRYYIYYGNPKAPTPDAWEPKRGVMLEVRKWPGGPADKLPQVQAGWAKGRPLGGDLVSHVSFGFNPFGESDAAAVYHYVGWFVPPEAGTYMIATSSSGGSWVLIDGQEAVAWPGSHGPVGDARIAKPVALSPGLHRLEYWNVNPGGPPMMVAAWKTPNGDRYEPIPAKAFLPVTEAALVETDLPGERLVADFYADNAGETWWPDRYAIRMRFRNLSKAISAQHGGRFEWDFGDGQTSALAAPTHVYLVPGDYAVTLKCSRVADANTFRTRVHVDRNWWKQTESAIDPIAKYADEAAQYNFQKLDSGGLVAAVTLFQHEELSKPLVAAASELITRSGVDEAAIHRLGLLSGEHLRKLGYPQEALAVFRQLEEHVKGPPRKADAAAQVGDTLLRDLGRFDDAEKEYQRVLKAYATSGADAALRRAQIGMGDVYRHRGDGAKARQAYTAAANIKVVSYPPNEAAVRIGTLARYVEEYTREKQWEWVFKFLDDWAWEFPQDKLLGHWSLLRASALVAKGERPAGLQEALDLLAANPGSPYAVRLLMLAAECHVAAGEKDKARLLLQTAVEDYPEDTGQAEARKRLIALGGPISGETTPTPRNAPEPKGSPAPAVSPRGPAPKPPAPPPPGTPRGSGR